MRRLNQRLAALAAAMLLPLAAQAPMAQGIRPAAADAAPARVIVKYRADSEMSRKQALTATGRRNLQAQALGERIGVALAAGAGVSERAHVVFAQGLTSASLAAKLAAQPDVEFAVPDERRHLVAAPNDPFYASRPATATSGGPAVGQWYMKPPGTEGTAANTAPAAINAEQAWDIAGGTGTLIVVAVLDTGIRKDHPDLLPFPASGNVLPGYDMVAADSAGVFVTANDGDGRDADASDPGDWITAADRTNPVFNGCEDSSSSWHGTQTIGLVGATANNSVGIAGVGRNVNVLPVRVLGKCGGYDSDILVGMQWAAGVYSPSELTSLGLPANPNPARVLSMSLGSTGTCSQAYRDATTRILGIGAVIVASAGNTAGHAVSTPANCPGFIAVGGLRHVGDKVGFSDLGSEITISAPGGNCVNLGATEPCLYPIMTTSNSGTTTPVAGAAGAIYTDGFGTASLGTSFAAPLVAGTVGMMLSVNPTLSPANVKQMLQQTARPFPTFGGSISIAVTTAAPTAALPVSLTVSQPPQCVAPTASSADQLECYCNTGTCGAGILDAWRAVTLANGGGLVPQTPVDRHIVSYSWSLVDGGGIATAINGATGNAPTVVPTGAGTFTLRLITTDNLGVTSTATTSVTVAAATTPPVTPPSAPSGGGGGGGGGALGVGWLMLLLSAVLALAAVARFERRRAARAVSGPGPSGRRR